MKTRTLLWVVISTGLLALCAAPPRVRPAGVAGSFYPADARELARTVDAALAQASEVPDPNVVALVAPHAGYQFSAHVAAHSYALLKGRKIARVVVISPSHVEAFPFAAIYDGTAYSTPLGQVPVDQAFAAKLAQANGLLKLSSRGHAPQEHALEVQLPFLQRVLGDFKLVPIVMGDQKYDTCRALGLALAKLMQGSSDTLIVASSDLSHFHPYDDAVRLDHKTLRAIGEWDYLSMSRNFENNVWEACGGGPIVAAMIAAERLGATEARILKYANSGDVTPDKSRVVGYGAVALVKGTAGPSAAAAFSLRAADRSQLLEIARRSVETAVKQRKLYDCPPVSDALMQERGAFVTLKENGQLRGCIGYVAPIKPLSETVRDVAAYAALKDERFPPVTAPELGRLEYEVSVLSPLRRVLDVNQIAVGRHGLVIRKGDYEGLLLPQVPVEQGWKRGTFLEQTCLKAGLPRNAWQDGDTDIFSFTALVFPEHPAAPPKPPARSPAPSTKPF
jgi:AmmeMemoRadiSam system protein B/AmmeMemoRadiSam system protein A